MADDLMFSAEELRIDEGLGYPKAYAKICRDRGFGPFALGPPFTFTPYVLQSHQASRAKELDEMFPIIDPKAKPSARPKIFVSLLWKQLNHLGNAGFDPETFRVDPYGNVLYIHADSASPLAWDVDHWFPCSRGGLTVSSNLRLLQWQVCKKKHNKLEFLVPWWDLQVGISVNQFLSIFASSNSDFRHRGFYLLFSNGECEELNESQTVDSHRFPQPFNESKKRSGLAPAAIVLSRKESNDTLLQSVDINRRHTTNSPIVSRKSRPSMSKENEVPDFVTNPYQAIVIARDSLRQREETSKKQAEIEKLDEEMMELKQKNEEERSSIQDLEMLLIKKRRRAEKCRRLAEAQSSYKGMLEKMIRDAMHQSVIYKEQARLNQAASNSLMARLEAQKAMCDSSERELHKKFKQKDELEKQVRPDWEQTRKRSRMDDIDILLSDENNDQIVLFQEPVDEQEKDDNTLLCLPGVVNSEHKQLRVFLEEEHKASEAEMEEMGNENGKKLQKMKIEEKGCSVFEYDVRFPTDECDLVEEDEESRKQRGKGNVEKWLQMLLEKDGTDQSGQIYDADAKKTEEIIHKMNLKYPQKEISKNVHEQNETTREVTEATKMIFKNPPYKIDPRRSSVSQLECDTSAKPSKINPGRSSVSLSQSECDTSAKLTRRKSFEVKEKSEKIGKFKEIARSESARVLRRIPSSPSIILGMKKGVDCMRRKPEVIGDDEDYAGSKKFIKSSYKVIKKAVKI
ncbi:hypothetical protein HanRHA438_Chr02g0049011 [Helianthus annuus]|uniref:Uncharacterized protein n=1 Tax=Helianthus annuus TaxID=4232 RepID=A0A251VCU3_HELAN|nr:titin homolog [Helianthus annuus]KAF5816990.1 hypothetical protein HanXRQr2_Chr02g0047891 [Helianthus annuus]KAJ0603518.1 hypothetical protein HanHA300_Chr02g0039201 [Helianthus annuus]KAJ0617433.1 hypothetical protein HanHA89_Chr02g0041861 [Helianthus annuus]KAJ0938361.1 hypothetical protein HanRHA438_Chr02g0049011 [Helianthus annuus]